MYILLHANKEFLIVAFTRRCIAKDGREACLDHRLETIQDTLGSSVGSTKEGVNSIFDAFAGLERITW